MDRHLRITRVKIKDFKGVAALDLKLDEELTVIAGMNGVGKTSILEALLLASSYVLNFMLQESGGLNPLKLDGEILRNGSDLSTVTISLSDSGSDAVKDFGIRAAPKIDFSDDASRSHAVKYLNEAKASNGLGFLVPLLIYFGQDRISLKGNASLEEIRQSSLSSTPNSISQFKEWFFEKEGDEGREVRERQDLDYSDPNLDAVRQVLDAMTEFQGIRSRMGVKSGKRELLFNKNDQEIPIEALSSGERVYFVLAADLARRLILTFPKLSLADSPGIVCIDEIDLHLHPRWQREVLKRLRDTFKACQFIVTTHSPQVIGGVEARHVRILTSDSHGTLSVKTPMASMGRDTNFILEALLDTPEREPEVDSLFEEFGQAMDLKNYTKADKLLSKLEELVEGGSSQVSILRNKLTRKKAAK